MAMRVRSDVLELLLIVVVVVVVIVGRVVDRLEGLRGLDARFGGLVSS